MRLRTRFRVLSMSLLLCVVASGPKPAHQADVDGTIVPESTRVEESSGFPQLDSAALQSVDLLRFAPAQRDGVPVATAFIQPVHFRHPDLAASGENQ